MHWEPMLKKGHRKEKNLEKVWTARSTAVIVESGDILKVLEYSALSAYPGYPPRTDLVSLHQRVMVIQYRESDSISQRIIKLVENWEVTV